MHCTRLRDMRTIKDALSCVEEILPNARTLTDSAITLSRTSVRKCTASGLRGWVQSEPTLLPSNPYRTAHRFPARTSFSCQIRLFKHPLSTAPLRTEFTELLTQGAYLGDAIQPDQFTPFPQEPRNATLPAEGCADKNWNYVVLT